MTAAKPSSIAKSTKGTKKRDKYEYEPFKTRKPKRDLSQEMAEERKLRLEKQRKLSAARRQNETEQQRRRRLTADRIRAKLRRMEWNDDNREIREKLFEELYSLPGYRYRGWKNETIEQYRERIDKDLECKIKNKTKKTKEQLEPDLEIAMKMVESMKVWEEYGRELNCIVSCMPKSNKEEDDVFRMHFSVDSPHKMDTKALNRELQITKGMLFSIDRALATFEKKHSLAPLGRCRPKWMVTPPGKGDATEQEVFVKVITRRPGCHCWNFEYGSNARTVFEWQPSTGNRSGEWVPSPKKESNYMVKGKNAYGDLEWIDVKGKDYHFNETGYRMRFVSWIKRPPPGFGDSFVCDPLLSGPSSLTVTHTKRIRKRYEIDSS